MSAQAALAQLSDQIGQEIGTSPWITIDQSMIDDFAALTFDDQWIHTDPARATRDTPFGGTIAHGFLTLSLASRMSYDIVPIAPGQSLGINYGFDRLRFLRPVRAGERVRGRLVLHSAELRSELELKRCHRLTIEVEDATPAALVADWLTLVVFDAP